MKRMYFVALFALMAVLHCVAQDTDAMLFGDVKSIVTGKHLDDAAFMYAPVYGATWYGGVSITL
ncbi:hypothetical protein HMPREF0671_06525 [Prevotella sp. S7 MS 2]|nr:hypothetical protein [Prevotella sp. S7 MS 2]KGI60372.1 hypothetical protein HMPREF0671_06525 [Prevotella sp. S7 MS 2]